MPTINSVIKTVRIPKDEWTRIEAILKDEGISLSGYVRGITPKNAAKISAKAEEIKEKTENESVYPTELKKMCVLSGVIPEDIVSDLCEKLETGELLISGGRLEIGEGNTPINLNNFLEACEENRVDPQKMIDTATQNIWRSGRA